MGKLLAVGAALTAALATPGAATARGPANEFTVGSAKTDTVILAGAEHASFSAHNDPALGGCRATGQIVYKSKAFEFTAKIVELTIVGNGGFFGGPITKVTSGPIAVGQSAFFDAIDSGLPEGTGEQFLFEAATTTPPGFTFCLEPLPGHPITSGNIVIKTGGP